MDSIGETLRQARHNKKVSLEDAGRATKIKVEILERLESEEFGALAAPAYTKGFLKLYSDYLGLDSAGLVEAYLQSQGGLRRQGLRVETEAQAKARKPRELQLPIRSVALVVAAVSIAVFGVLLGRNLWARRSRPVPSPLKTPATLPKAGFDPYYQPKHKPAPDVLEPLGK
jgi:cytoskeletal protein RodZ